MILMVGGGIVRAKTVSFVQSMQVLAVSASALTTHEITTNLRVALMMRKERIRSTVRWFSLGSRARCEDKASVWEC